MQIVVNEELKAYIDPLSAEEYEALERSILAEGCRDALVLWGELLVDGHNRYDICQKHGLPFQTLQSQRFQSMEDVHLWMIDQHLGRRSVSDYQRGVLALRKREIVAQRRARQQEAAAAQSGAATMGAETPPWEADAGDSIGASPAASTVRTEADPLSSREDIARAARLRSSQVQLIEKIHTQAAPEVVAALKSGAISLSAAAAVATLSEEEQKAAAGAGELKQAAKRVREAKRKPREGTAPAPQDAAGEGAAGDTDEVQALRKRVAELSAENDGLRKQVANLLGQLMKSSPSAPAQADAA
ncbi:plasmid replication/partition related protein [Variovorax sp. LARHSF232]